MAKKKVFASDFDGTLYFYLADVKLPPENVEKTMILIRRTFPQTNPVFFKKPQVETVEKLLSVVEGMDQTKYGDKIDMILDIFGN